MQPNFVIVTIIFFVGACSSNISGAWGVSDSSWMSEVQHQSSGPGVYSVTPHSSPCKRDSKIPDMKTWFARTPAAFDGKFEASRSRRAKLIETYPKLKIGMSKAEVEALLKEIKTRIDHESKYLATVSAQPAVCGHGG